MGKADRLDDKIETMTITATATKILLFFAT